MPQQGVVKIDPDTPHEIASLVGCGVMTGVGAALNTAKVVPGSSVVVFGCGGVGISAIQGARVAGASEIVAVDLVDSKLEDAQALRCHPRGQARRPRLGQGVDHRRRRLRLRLRGHRPAATMRSRLRRHPPRRHHVHHRCRRLDKTVSFNAFELFFDEKTIMGSYYGSADVRSDFTRMLNLWKNGRLDLEGMISKKIAIDDVNDAVADLKAGTVIRSVITF